jgi:hypothetical protein
MFSLSTRTVNLLLLAVLLVTGLSGIGTFLVGHSDQQWMFWTHRIASFALLPLMFWKVGIIVRSYAKRGLSSDTVLSAMGAILFVLAFTYGVLWATAGVGGGRLPFLGNTSGLGLHVTFALTFIPLLFIHVVNRWPQIRARVPDFASRRTALRYLMLGGFGLLAWRSSESITVQAGWSGSDRRFTGSRLNGQFSGNRYPTVNWLSDPKPEIEAADWRLQLDGLVNQELELTMDDLADYELDTYTAILDCTGGWYTEQHWSGIPIRALFDQAGVSDGARSAVFTSETGYRRRYDIEEAGGMLLAFEVSGEPLSRGHGYPVRLVAPGQRGYGWVKWVTHIELSNLPAWVESPLPLQ